MSHNINSVRSIIADVFDMKPEALDWDMPLGEQLDLDEYEDDICEALSIEFDADVTPEMLMFETVTLRDSAELIIEHFGE